MTRDLRDFLVHLVPLDARGRRAVDEVIADWDHEAAIAIGAKGRLVVAARGAAALVATVLFIAVGELKVVPTSRALWITLAWVALPFAFLGTAELMPWGLGRARMAGEDLPPAAFVLAWSLLLLPPALFAGAHRAGRRGASVPYLGLALGSFALMALIELAFPDLIPALFGASRPPVSGFSLELPSSRSVLLERLIFRVTLEQLAASLLVVGPMLVLLAGQLRCLATWRQNRLTPVAVTASYLTLTVFAVGALPYRLAGRPLAHVVALTPWLTPALVLAALVVVAAARKSDAGVTRAG